MYKLATLVGSQVISIYKDAIYLRNPKSKVTSILSWHIETVENKGVYGLKINLFINGIPIEEPIDWSDMES